MSTSSTGGGAQFVETLNENRITPSSFHDESPTACNGLTLSIVSWSPAAALVIEGSSASTFRYLNVDALEPSITKAAAGDQETIDNVKPLQAVGLSSWNDDGVIRFSFKVSTN